MLGIVTKKIKKNAKVNICSVSKYAPIPKPISSINPSFLRTQPQEGIVLQLDVTLRHLQVHLSKQSLSNRKPEVLLWLLETTPAILQIWQSLQQRNATQRMVVRDHFLSIIYLQKYNSTSLIPAKR